MKIFTRLIKQYISKPTGKVMKKYLPDCIYSEYRNGLLSYAKAKGKAKIFENKGWFKRNYHGVKGLAKSVGPIPFITAAVPNVIAPCVPGVTELGLCTGIVIKRGVKVGAKKFNSIFRAA